MRILVTGLTGAHSGRPLRGAVGRMNPVEFTVKALRDAGHEVAWEGHKLQDEPSGADLLWFVLSPPKSASAMNYGAGALSLLGRWRGPYVVQIDDWNLHNIFKDTNSLLRDPDSTLYRVINKEKDELFFRGETRETVRLYQKYVVEGLRRMVGAGSLGAQAVVVLAYGWGDLGLLGGHLPAGLAQRPLVGIDPSPAMYEILREQAPVPKERRWVMAALAKHETWLHGRMMLADWPVQVLGAQGDKTDEAGVYEAYRRARGALSPPYPHAGSGWWRTRFLYAAAAHTVLVCEDGEADALGPAYQLRVKTVEERTDDELDTLAQVQADALRGWMLTWEDFVGQCDGVATGNRKRSGLTGTESAS